MPDFPDATPKLIAVVAWITVASGVAFLLHALDKRRARCGGRRIAEHTLHLCELVGGWPGAWIAMLAFRHKTQKRSYRFVFALIVATHVGLLLIWASRTW